MFRLSPRKEVSFLTYLFVSQRLDRIDACRLHGGVDPEDNADRHRDAERD